MNKILNIPIPKIKTIYHIGDIHIRNLKRHTEYQLVFDRLKDEIKKDLDSAVIYVAGDIVHAKTEMSPELIDVTVKFLKMLAELAPTIVITGNHDCNLNNKNRLDALLPIIEAMAHPNIFYLREAGIYSAANIDFAVFSRLNNINEWPKSKECTSPVKVALYHGTVQDAISDTGFKLTNDKVKITKFDGFDLALLGDIHKHQFLDKKKKRIAYPGSLIQQNHGEDYYNHGMLKWNVDTISSEFIRIENDYGFYTLRIKDGEIQSDVDIPKNPRLRIQLENTPIADVQRIVAEVRKKYNVQDIVISTLETDKFKTSSLSGNAGSIIGDINDTGYQNELIQEFLTQRYNLITDDIISEVKEINNKTNSQLEPQEAIRGFTWVLKKLEFSNMFSYGEDNVIDFTDMSGVYGLFAPNTAGKSSLIDVILYALFDKCSRATVAMDVLNDDKTWFSCKLNFQIGDVDYFIEKVGKIGYAGEIAHCPVSINFWKVENDILESLNGEQRRDTNNNIQTIIGSYENFVMTAMSLQNDNTGFINMTQSGRKKLLTSFSGLDIFEQLYNLAKEDIKSVDTILKDIKKQDLAYDLASIEKEIERKRTVYEKKKSALEEKQAYKDNVNDAIIIFTKELRDVSVGNLNITDLEAKKKNVITNIEQHKVKIQNNHELVSSIKEKSLQLLDKYKEYDLDSLNNRMKELKIKETEKNKLSIALETLKTEIKHKQDKLDKLSSLEYDVSCSFCMNNIFVKDAIETREMFEKERGKLVDLQSSMGDLNQLITSMSIVNSEFDDFNQLNSDLNILKSQYVKADSEINVLNTNLELQGRYVVEIDTNIDLYFKNQNAIQHNLLYQEKIDKLERERAAINSEILSLQSEAQKMHAEIKVLENKRNGIIDLIDKARMLESRYKAYEYYLACVSRDGVPYELISKVVPILETKTNNILTQIADFNVMLNVDNKNIDAYIVYDTNKSWALNLTSGMEKFVSSIALRVALNSISIIPKPSCLFIDEGFGNLDADNLPNMALLFNYLKSYYDFLIVISHLDIMRDMIDNMIELKKVDGFSKIDYQEQNT